MPITKDQILRAIEEIQHEGKDKPTNAAIRAKLGSGSLSTINAVLKEWKAQQSTTITAPPEAAEVMKPSLDRLWTLARADAEAGFAYEKAGLLEEIEAHKEFDLQNEKEIESLDAELKASKARAAELEAWKAQAQAEAEESRKNVALLREQLEENREVIKDYRSRLAAQEAEFAEKLKATTSRLEGRIFDLSAQNSELFLYKECREAEEAKQAEKITGRQVIEAAVAASSD